MLIIITFLHLLQLSQSKLISENENLDNEMGKEYDQDTQLCVEAAKLKHSGDPNAGLDHFVACLLKQLEKVIINYINRRRLNGGGIFWTVIT